MLEASGADNEGRTVCVAVTQLQICFAIVAGRVHQSALWAVRNNVDPAEEHVAVAREEWVSRDLGENIWDMLASCLFRE